MPVDYYVVRIVGGKRHKTVEYPSVCPVSRRMAGLQI